MNSISPYNSSFPASTGFQEVYQSYSELQAARLSVSESQTKDITIYTEEGDRVTISTEDQNTSQMLTYEGLQRSMSATEGSGFSQVKNTLAMFKGEEFQSQNYNSFSISIEGDLSKEEMKDITAALKDIDRVMTDFLNNGNLVNTAVKGLELDNLRTISGIEASYIREKFVVMEQVTMFEDTRYMKAPDEKMSPLEQDETYNPAKSILDQLLKIIEDSEVDPEKLRHPIHKLLQKHRNHSGENQPLNSQKNQLINWVEKQLDQGFENLSEKSNVAFESPMWG